MDEHFHDRYCRMECLTQVNSLRPLSHWETDAVLAHFTEKQSEAQRLAQNEASGTGGLAGQLQRPPSPSPGWGGSTHALLHASHMHRHRGPGFCRGLWRTTQLALTPVILVF